MKIIWDIVGIALILAGGVWFMLGVGVLPSSLMSGQIQWAVYGGLAILLGAGLLLYVNRRQARCSIAVRSVWMRRTQAAETHGTGRYWRAK